MSGTISPSEMHSLFAGLDLAHGGTGRCGSVESARTPRLSADQFTLPLELAVDERNGLQAWQSALAERWQQTWPESIRSRWSIGGISCKATRLREFMAATVGQHRFQVARGDAEFTHWLSVDDGLVTGHLDALLGASEADSDSDPRRKWGPVEHQLTSRLINSISDSLFPALPEANRPGWQISTIASAEELLSGVSVFLSCELVEFDLVVSRRGSAGHLRIAISRALVSHCLAPGSSYATSPAQSGVGSGGESVSLRATLGPVTLSPAEFDQLQVGDVVLIGGDAQATCQVSSGGQSRFRATIGSHQGHKAIRLVAETQ